MAWGDDDGNGKNPWGSVPPGGGRGPRGGPPPEYDDIVGKFQDRMRGMMPGFFKGGMILGFLAVVVVLWLFSGFYRVEPSEQGVVLRFGEWVRTEPQGFHWHVPYPVERVYVLNVTQVNQEDIGFRSDPNERASQSDLLHERLMLTGDENIVDIAFSVFWKIDDAKSYLFNIESPQRQTVKEIAESVMREIIGQRPIQNALTEGRGEIQTEAQKHLQEVLNNYGAGILITEIRLEKVDPPAQVIDAFRDVQAAAADRETLQNKAEEYANKIIPEARGEAVKKIQEAQAYKEQVIARATGEASRFLAVYQQYAKAKDVTKRRIYLETMEEILSGMNKIIVDEGAGTGVVPYLPLPELKARQDQGGNQ